MENVYKLNLTKDQVWLLKKALDSYGDQLTDWIDDHEYDESYAEDVADAREEQDQLTVLRGLVETLIDQYFLANINQN